jgi:branched-chain amino acid transport system permease protein
MMRLNPAFCYRVPEAAFLRALSHRFVSNFNENDWREGRMDSLLQQFLQQLINGISLGSIYALIALGYTMVYGIMRLINFAHGDIYMVGAYVGFFSTTLLHVGFFPALIIAMVMTGLVGMLIERVAYRPLRSAPKIAILITAIGVSLLLEYGGILLLTPQPRTFPAIFTADVYNIGPLVINSQQVLILAVSVVLMILLTYLVQKTKLGKAMRAVSFDTDAAMLMGINVNTVISFTFGVGSALAGAAGVLVGVYYNSIDPLMGIMPGLKAFIAAVLGGIGVIPGAMAGGVILGVIEALVSGFISSTFRDAAAFGILIIILLLKPSGLLGTNVREKV